METVAVEDILRRWKNVFEKRGQKRVFRWMYQWLLEVRINKRGTPTPPTPVNTSAGSSPISSTHKRQRCTLAHAIDIESAVSALESILDETANGENNSLFQDVSKHLVNLSGSMIKIPESLIDKNRMDSILQIVHDAWYTMEKLFCWNLHDASERGYSKLAGTNIFL